MKKISTLLLLAAMTFSIISCEKTENTEHSDEENYVESEVKEKDNSEEETGSDDSENSVNVETKSNDVPEDAPEDACGENLTWRYDEDTATLYIEGEGDMWDYIRRDEEKKTSYVVSRPWQQYSDSIKKVSFGNGVTGIGNYSFYSYYALSSIEISDNIARIGNSALSDCPSLEIIIVSPNNKYFISEDNILFDKEKKTLVCYPDGKREKNITIPAGITTIGSNAFYDCSSLESVIFPDSVTVIGNGAFWGCTGIKSLTLPDSVTEIKNAAFWNCNSLSEIYIPAGVVSIGKNAFANCNSMKTICFAGTKEQWEALGIEADNINNATVNFGK